MDGADDLVRVGQIARLYLVVHGRPPDPGGLRAFVQHLRDGRSLVGLAAEFLESGEFRNRVGADGALEALCRAGRVTAEEGAALMTQGRGGGLPGLVVALVTGPDAARRLPLLPALYPEGVPLDDGPGYRLWLAERDAVPLPPPGTAPEVTFVMLLRKPEPALLLQAVTAALSQRAGLSELILVAPGWLPRTVRRALRSRGVAVLAGAPWADDAALFRRALRRAAGRFIVLVGQHDVLDPRAAVAFSGVDAHIVLADDDRLDEDGLRYSPRLGAGWDPDRVLAAGVPGVVAIRAALLREIAGMRALGGFSERDLVLRAAQACGASRVVHVPSVLLSRRGEAAAGGTVEQAAQMAGGPVVVDGPVVRVLRALPKPQPLVSVIVPTRDRAGLLRTCTEALLRRTDYPALEVVIVDNGSVEPDALALLAALARDERVRVVPAPGPFDWSALNNAGVAASQGTVVVLLNNDIDVVVGGWLEALVIEALRPEVGAVGAKLLYPDGRVQHAGVVLGPAARGTHVWRFSAGDAPGYLDQLRIVREVTAVTGACLAMRREVYQAVGGCAAGVLQVTWNDVDLCLRVRAAGLRVIWTSHARLLHLEQASRGSDETPERQVRYQQERAWMQARWGSALDNDPFMSPHLQRNEGPNEVEPRLAS